MVDVKVPPIKSQGIKTKLVNWINSEIPTTIEGRWFEPFLGTGVVALNIAPQYAVLSDINPHLINFYKAIQNNEINAISVKEYLEREGQILLNEGESHYYYIRSRFNECFNPLDFLFINRAGFNGMIRFNKKGKFNIPFCRKPNRFAQAYVTKIVNQVQWVSKKIALSKYEFLCQDFESTISMAGQSDFIYCDPPYIGRHVDYYSTWDDAVEKRLAACLSASGARFMLSSWYHNQYRSNEYMKSVWAGYRVETKDHFYHVGGSEANRNPMVEALVTNYEGRKDASVDIRDLGQLTLC